MIEGLHIVEFFGANRTQLPKPPNSRANLPAEADE